MPPVPNPVVECLTALAQRLGHTLAVARGLVAAGRSVSLAGFQDGVGMLCAKALDLPLEEARPLLPVLLELRAQLEALHATMQPADRAECRSR